MANGGPSAFQEDGRLSVLYIAGECLKKLDTKQQTSTLLSLVWRDSACEEAFTLMAAICHTLMVQHRVMVPRARRVLRPWPRALGSLPCGGAGLPRARLREPAFLCRLCHGSVRQVARDG